MPGLAGQPESSLKTFAFCGSGVILHYNTTGKDNVANKQIPKITDLKPVGNFRRAAAPRHLTIRNWQFGPFFK
jgi:hypothetical protein